MNQSLAAFVYFGTFWIWSHGVIVFFFMLCLICRITHKERFSASGRPLHVWVRLIAYLNLPTCCTSERERMYIVR